MRIAIPLCALALVACGETQADYGGAGDDDDSDGLADAGADTPECFSASECPVGWECSEFGVCVPPPSGSDGGVPPAEVEYELSAPVSSRRYVWVAMKGQDAVAKIDGARLEVTSIGVGDEPEVLVTLPGTDTAIVLDHNHGAATVVRPADGSDLTEVAATLPDLNAIGASPSGRAAVAYFDLAKAIADAGGIEAVEDVGSFQDVTVIGLDGSGTHAVDLTVGFRPREVEFDAAGARAYVITDDGISVLTIDDVIEGGPTIIPPIPVTPDPFGDASGLEVDVLPAGDLALVREPGAAWLRAVSLTGLDAGAMWEIALPGVPSDLELSPDGTRAFAVLREQGAIAVLDVPADLIDASGVEIVAMPGATLGSLTLTGDGSRGVLYTNATLDERLTVIDLGTPGAYPYRTFPLEKSVRAIGMDPAGAKVLLLHARAPGDPDDAVDFDEYIDRSWGYSIVDVATGFAKLQITPVDPGDFAFAEDAPRAYLCLDGGDAEGALAEVHEIELDTGVVRPRALGSPPDTVGVLPDSGKVFVSQRHPLGRVTFLDVASGAARTLTGFDLNSQIVD